MTSALWVAATFMGVAMGQVVPIVGPDEVVVGRARDGGSVWLLTDEARLVHVSTSGRIRGAVTLKGLRDRDGVWGLAHTSRGTLVTLGGVSRVIEFDRSGLVSRRWHLDRQYLGLHGAPGGLLLQPVAFNGGRRVLEWTSHPSAPPRAVGRLRVTSFGSRTGTLARNLVGCGMTQADEVPCWFNHDPRVYRVSVRTTGGTVVDLGSPWNRGPGREQGPLDVRGPVVDALVASDGSLWVLLRQTPSARPVLVRYSADGRQTDRQDLDVDARLLIGADSYRVRLMSRDGVPVEVGPR